MFTWKEEQMNKPVKIWLENIEEAEEGCLEQARHLAQLPFIHKWACLMPDTHQGKGMPIGGVIAADGVIIPNAVGVDIGCGMNFVSTNIKAGWVLVSSTFGMPQKEKRLGFPACRG